MVIETESQYQEGNIPGIVVDGCKVMDDSRGMSDCKNLEGVGSGEALPAPSQSPALDTTSPEVASGPAPGPAYYAALEAVAADRRKSHAADARLARQLAGLAPDIHLQRLTAAIANRDTGRARRAEMIAERLAAVLQALYDSLQLEGTDSPNGAAAAAALDAWHQHRADLDTLEQAQQEPAEMQHHDLDRAAIRAALREGLALACFLLVFIFGMAVCA